MLKAGFKRMRPIAIVSGLAVQLPLVLGAMPVPFSVIARPREARRAP